jgi:hypothetical protein
MADNIVVTSEESDDESDDIVSAEILSLTPAMPGWFACYTEDDNPRALNVHPIAVFAVIEVTHANNETYRVVRPFVGMPDGAMEDVVDYPNFLCVTGPGQDPRTVASEMRETRGEPGPKIIMPNS